MNGKGQTKAFMNKTDDEKHRNRDLKKQKIIALLVGALVILLSVFFIS